MNQQYIQLLIVALAIGASGIGWVLRKLGEQAQRRAMLQEIERRRLEALRTGKDPSANQPPAFSDDAQTLSGPASARPMDIAERRKRQLEELRRRQMARQPGGGGASVGVGQPSAGTMTPQRARSPGSPRSMPPSIPGSMGPTVPMPTRRSPAPAPVQRRPQEISPQRTAADAARREAIQRQGDRARRKAEEQSRLELEDARRKAQLAAEEGESSTHRLVKDIIDPSARQGMGKPASARPASPMPLAVKSMTAQDWRRAMVMNEILGPPVALRESEP